MLSIADETLALALYHNNPAEPVLWNVRSFVGVLMKHRLQIPSNDGQIYTGFNMTDEHVTVLFDEFGTPQIANTDRTDWFLGVSVRYSQAEESGIFRKCEDVFGLTKTNPQKNKQISSCRAIRIAELLGGFPASIFVSGVNTTDPEYRKTITDYVDFANTARKEVRQVRERPIAQIMYSQVIDHCLFHSITGYFEAGGGDAEFSVYIDNWSIPQADVEIYLEERVESIHRSISPLCLEYHTGRLVSIGRIELLAKDTNRKRFVDVVASVVSRAYLKADNPRYSGEPMDVLREAGMANFSDATGYSTKLMMMMNGQSRDRNSNYR